MGRGKSKAGWTIERVERALRTAGVGAWDWDPRDDTVEFDERWCAMLGLEAAATPGHLETWEGVIHPDDLQRWHQDMLAHLQGFTPVCEGVYRMRHAGGDWLHVLHRGRVVAEDATGSPTRFTGVDIDVSGWARAQRVRAESERMLKAMVRNLPFAVAMLNRKLRYVAVSDQWLLERDLEAEDVIGKRPKRIAADARAPWLRALRPCREGETLGRGEDPVTLPDGTRRWLRWKCSPWKTVDDRVGGVIVVTEDITGEVELRAEREQQARLASLGLMAGAVGHELNSPLQVLVLEAEDILSNLASGAPDLDEVVDAARTVRETALQLGRIVRAMTALARDGSRDDLEDVSIADLLTNVEALSTSRMAGRRVRLEVQPTPASVVARGRSTELGQVLLNLLTNAMDAVQTADERWVRLVTSVEDGHVVFRCIDSGPGVPPELRERIMDPFFTTKPVGAGTGLGLSISQSLAQRLGGYLKLSEAAPHTTFEFAVPAAGDETGSRDDGRATEGAGGG
ncbi:MAG: PAS domain-containing protein [Myxococcales bacterium]|nr:PAS domain-containing protein [Myxococcales bacterium]